MAEPPNAMDGYWTDLSKEVSCCGRPPLTYLTMLDSLFSSSLT